MSRESLTATENTISTLREETSSYRDRVELLQWILYGMIAFCVILLFVVVNLLLKKKDLKTELESYREYGYTPEEMPEEIQPAYRLAFEDGSTEERQT